MTILGIDPGIATVGFGVVLAEKNVQRMSRYGVVSTAAGIPLANRLMQIYDDVTELIRTFSPEAVAVEELFFNTNVKTAITVAQARGVILLAAEMSGAQVFEYTPLQVKQAVVGYGRAQKKQVMEMTRRILGLDHAPKPDDAADALAIALCHARSSSSLLTKQGGGAVCSTT